MASAAPSPSSDGSWTPFLVLAGGALAGAALLMALVWRAYPRSSMPLVTLDDTIRMAVAGAAGWACLRRAREEPPSAAVAWRSLGWAMLSMAAATLYLVVGLDILEVRPPWSLLRHLGYLASQLLLARSLLAWPVDHRLRTQRLQALLDGLMISAALFFIAWGGFLGELVRRSRQAGSAYGLTLVYPLLAVALAALWLFQESRLSRGRAPLIRLLLRMGFLFHVAYQACYGVLSISGTYRTFGVGESLDLLALAGYAAFGLAALAPVHDAPEPPASAGRQPAALLLPFLPGLGAMAYGAGLLFLGRPMDPVMVAAGSLLGLVLCLRQYLALRDLEQLSGDLERRVEERTAELRRQQAEILRNQRMQVIGALAAGFAHDFKNLLNVIQLGAEVMLREPGEPDPAVHAIKDAAGRASGLVQQVLAAGRRQDLRPSDFDLSDFLRSQAGLLEAALGTRGRLLLELPAEGPAVRMDPDQLHQVVLNLVGNAADAMARPGTVALRVRRDPLEPFGVLEVADDGSGIPPELMERIFEPFFTTKGEGKGTGLGLASVQGILWQSGGSVAVASEPGRGTTFTLRIPCA